MSRIIPVLLIAALSLTSGCYNIRKKFIRKKKAAVETPVYIDFQSYPEAAGRGDAAQRVVFIRSWLEEAVKHLDEGGNFKRVRYSLSEALSIMSDLEGSYTGPDLVELKSFENKLQAVKDDVDRCLNPTALDKLGFSARLIKFEKAFRGRFKVARSGGRRE